MIQELFVISVESQAAEDNEMPGSEQQRIS